MAATGKSLRALVGEAAADVTVTGVSNDSRDVRPGDLFLACAGDAFDGHDFVAQAVAAGAVAVCSERPVAAGVPNVVLADLRARQGAVAAAFYDDPSAALGCIGVTGTNGKTSICFYAASLLDDGALIGTVGWGTPGRLCPSRLTTEDPVTLQKRLATLRDAGARWVAMEASSHALEQGRVAAVRFDIAVFSNLTRDHLDYHGSMEAYGNAKAVLFEREGLAAAVLNGDDPFADVLAARVGQGVDVLRYGAAGDVRWSGLDYGADGVGGRWHTPWGEADFRLPCYGDFSVANAAAALAAACLAGTDFATAVARQAALPTVPGRMQPVRVAGMPLVVVDYAHTPDALAAVLAALRRHLRGRLICVFGCGGDRDRGKRPLMARAVEAGADHAIVTSDNPRGEAPEAIIREVLAGFSAPQDVETEVDRASAIARAIAGAGPDDVVLVAGKGHEGYQEIQGIRHPFDDVVTARALLGAGTGVA